MKFSINLVVNARSQPIPPAPRNPARSTVLFVQYPGPTTGARPIYEGRMNLKAAPEPAEIDLEH